MPGTESCDVLVVGSGAGGLSAAITARLAGLDVLVAEKHDEIGGSTARSGGMIWAPCNPLAVAEGVDDSPELARQYVKAEAGNLFEPERVDAYLRSAPAMIETFRTRTSAMRFVRADSVADNHPHLPGAREWGRTVTVPPFDARQLGKHRKLLAKPLPELTFMGMQIQPGAELNQFFAALGSWRAFRFVAGRVAGQMFDKVFYGGTTRLANGNALSARLLKSALDLGIGISCASAVSELVVNNGAVTGAVVETPTGRRQIFARRGVVLACGGYPHDPGRRRQLSPIGALGAGAYALGPETNQGDGLTLAEAVGGVVEDRLPNTISWTPVSRVPRAGGGFGLFPHSFDRYKPGYVMVTRDGRRFASEGAVGNDLIRALADACGGFEVAEAFMILDERTRRRYGVGVVRPWPVPVGRHLRSGYLVRRVTLGALADALGVDRALEDTVARYNAAALEGRDPEFERGQSDFERRNGDPRVRPNGCLAPIAHGPYYGLRIYPGDFSTLAGLRIDHHARVLRADGSPVPRLYAAGNDACSMFGGNSPAGGATLGPALTFGYIAGLDLARLEPAG